MREHAICIAEHDMKQLRELLEEGRRGSGTVPEHLAGLAAELERGQVVPTDELPPDVITMNSRVRLIDLDTGEETVYTLVLPEDADIDQNRISVLAPIGTGMLGYRAGDVFEWKVPGGKRRLKVAGVLHQPKAADEG